MTEFKDNPNPAYRSGKFLVATRVGPDPRFITMVGHSDTVFEKLNPFEPQADGKIAKGSGVADEKGGLVVAISALASYLKTDQPHFSIRIIVSPSEEIGSLGFQDDLTKYSQDSILILGLEPSLENGNVISSRKGVRWYQVTVTGKEAHAGVHHDIGINACHDLAVKVDKAQRLTDYKKGNTVSVGRIEGGKDKFNIVCGEAKAKIDSRFSSQSQGDALASKIENILKTPVANSAKTGEKTVTRFEIANSIPPFSISKETEPLLKTYLGFIKEIEGKTHKGEATGGAADLNFMSRKGVMILDGLGPIGGGYHTSDEYVVLSSLKTRAQALSKLLGYVNKNLKN